LEAATRTQRSDARRNREVVIDSAITLLNTNPTASMAEIAAASKVGRTTVYRHFPNRDDLLVALFTRVVEESRTFTTELAATATDAEDMLRRLAPQMIDLGLKYRFLHSYRNVGQETLDESKQVPDDPVRVYLDAAQARGEVRDDFPSQWIATTIQALAIAALDDIFAGLMERDEADRLLGETLVASLIAR
jgi:AcrR family transcriptional regulator